VKAQRFRGTFPGVYRLLALVPVVVLAGCPNKSSPGPSDPGSGKPPPASGKLPDGPPLATPGERMTYRVNLQGIDLAQYSFGVGDVADLDGKKSVVIQSHAKAVGIVTFVAKIDDHFASWIDVQTGRSLRFQVDEYESGNPSNIEHSVIEFAKRDGDTLPVAFHMNEEPPKPEPQKISTGEAWDFNSFVFALRSWEGPPGTAATTEVMRSRFMWHVEVKIRGKEKVVTELPVGEVNALRFDAHTYKVTRDGAKAPNSDERDFSVWISDDAGRVPLQIVARTDYGDMKMQITDYEPGSGQSLRP
jgi:uncharacterized protein DUF3108